MSSTLIPRSISPLAGEPRRHNIEAVTSPTAHLTHLAEVRAPLLDLHKSLVDAERREYERRHGRLENAEFLKVLMADAQFSWLKPLTALIVRIDETLEDGGDGAGASGELRRLLVPDAQGSAFQRRYAEVLQLSPDAVVDHGRTLRALTA